MSWSLRLAGKRQRRAVRLCLASALLVVALLALAPALLPPSLALPLLLGNPLKERRFVGADACPACFGVSWCRRFSAGQLVLDSWHRLRFLDFVNVKQVYFGHYDDPREGRKAVVLKRLGSASELAALDRDICQDAAIGSGGGGGGSDAATPCHPALAMLHWEPFHQAMLGGGSHSGPRQEQHLSPNDEHRPGQNLIHNPVQNKIEQLAQLEQRQQQRQQHLLNQNLIQVQQAGPPLPPQQQQQQQQQAVVPRLLTPAMVAGWSDMVRCPSQRLLDRVVRRYAEARDSGSVLLSHLHEGERAQLLLTLRFNPEPLVLQSFPADEGWPFPKYHGACGRLVVEALVGPTLWELWDAPWQRRADLAAQLLDLASQLSDNDLDYALYPLDVTPDNFAVGERDGRVVLVDAENVLVVDKRALRQEKPDGWDKWYESGSEDGDDVGGAGGGPNLVAMDSSPPDGACEGCLSFSRDALCTRAHHDHNFYAVCRSLLSPRSLWRGRRGGLLHSAPRAVASTGRLVRLVERCADPRGRPGLGAGERPGERRVQAARELRAYLAELLAGNNEGDGKWEEPVVPFG
ncbi:divergent protein kinase domain 2A-like [Petromyzon marinus]|uniref:Divergent protein kinase domain 2A-like n=1 Tax=Petromyzon marinus TaxID=7757 RepID=A0AAJ7XCC7_PETMA|nr:divergent protein kinase domain 2A-like [Petromyzon marinus]